MYTQRYLISRHEYGVAIIHNVPGSAFDVARIVMTSRQFEHIDFKGDNAVDRIKLAYVKVRVMECMKNVDTLHGIWFHFGKETSYGTFFKVIDILLSDKEALFQLAGDDIRYYHHVPGTDLPKPGFLCGNTLPRVPPAAIEDPRLSIEDLWKYGNRLVCVFCILLFSYFYGLLRKRY